MSIRIVSIMRTRAENNGWLKTTTSDNTEFRTIRIGSQRNCNEDNLLCDPTTTDKIKAIMDKYNVTNYQLENINTEYEFSTQVLLAENIYNEFIQNLEKIY